MKSRKAIGFLAALLVFSLLSVALVVHSHHMLRDVLWAFSTLSCLAGVVTVNYKWPVTGLTAPTAAQSYGLGEVTAQVNTADADTTIVITHNFGLSAAELANLWPIVIVNVEALTTSPSFTYSKASNSVTITKASTSGTGGTFDVYIIRPKTSER